MLKPLLCWSILAVSSALLPGANAAVFETSFKGLPDYSPALDEWKFRGVSGDVLNGAYEFTGVNISSGEYWDIKPMDTRMQPRSFPAGNEVSVEGDFRIGPHPTGAFEPGKGKDQRIGLVIGSSEFQRRLKLEETPEISFCFLRTRQGKRVFELQLPKISKYSVKTFEDQGWEEGKDYTLSLVFKKDQLTASASCEGKTVWRRIVTDHDLSSLFPKAYPEVRNLWMTGRLARFKADNLDSALPEQKAAVFAVPEKWQEQGGKTFRMKLGESIDFADALKRFDPKKPAVLTAEVTVPTSGKYIIRGDGDYFWKMECNGKVIADFMKSGNGSNGRLIIFPLKAGKNELKLTLKCGSNGWAWQFVEPTREEIQEALANNPYGSDRLYWNLYKIMADLAMIAHDNIRFPKLLKEIQKAQAEIPPTLDAKGCRTYDPLLDRAYSQIYEARQYHELLNTLSEFRAWGIPEQELDELKKIAETMHALLNREESIRSLAEKAEEVRQQISKKMNGFAEGVSRGKSFGRFGWVTSASLGEYSSGDGLLTNQVLADGAIARQYVFSAANPKLFWRVNFRFEGKSDETKAGELASLPVCGTNRTLEFGYDPERIYTSTTNTKVKVNSVNWVGKKFSYGDNFTAKMNLLAPALRLESAKDMLVLTDSPTGKFSFAAWKTSDGKIKTVPLVAGKTVYDREKDGKLGANWMIFWNGKPEETDVAGHRGSIPLQVIFQRCPEKVERTDSELKIALGKNGALWLNTLFGTDLQPVENWSGLFPLRFVKAADIHARIALAAPEDCHEFYRLSDDGKSVEIINKIGFLDFKENDWNLEPLRFVPIPPPLTLMVKRGFDAVLPKNLNSVNYPTVYGPLHGIYGDEVRYTLPVPDIPDIMLPRNAEASPADWKRIADHSAADLESHKFRLYDERLSRAWVTLNFPGAHAKKTWQYLPEKLQEYYRGLYRYNMKEITGFRTNRIWRSVVEPYSNCKYHYSFSIRADKPGDAGVFGDRGYGVGLFFIQLEFSRALTGDTALLREIWRDNEPLAPADAVRDGRYLTVDKMRGYLKNVHDWAWMDDGSNDSGDNGPVVDCSQGPFAGHVAYLRMARKIGNSSEIAKGSYHLAKSTLPMIARAPFTDYGREHGLVGMDSVNQGFREFITPKSFCNLPMNGYPTTKGRYYCSLAALLAYCFQEEGLDVYFPYAKYVWNDLRRMDRYSRKYQPDMGRGVWTQLPFRLFDGQSVSQVRPIYEKLRSKAIFYLRNDMDRGMMPLLMLEGNPLVLTEFFPLQIPDFSYHPSEAKVVVKLKDVPDSFTLEALSSSAPQEITVNGSASGFDYDPVSRPLP